MKTINAFVVRYWVTGVWVTLFSLNSLGTCVLAASSGCVWENLDEQSKLTVLVAVFVNWTGTIMAFLSRVAKKVNAQIVEEVK